MGDKKCKLWSTFIYLLFAIDYDMNSINRMLLNLAKLNEQWKQPLRNERERERDESEERCMKG